MWCISYFLSVVIREWNETSMGYSDIRATIAWDSLFFSFFRRISPVPVRDKIAIFNCAVKCLIDWNSCDHFPEVSFLSLQYFIRKRIQVLRYKMAHKPFHINLVQKIFSSLKTFIFHFKKRSKHIKCSTVSIFSL